MSIASAGLLCPIASWVGGSAVYSGACQLCDSNLLSRRGKRCCVGFFLSLSLFIGIVYSKLHYERSLCRLDYQCGSANFITDNISNCSHAASVYLLTCPEFCCLYKTSRCITLFPTPRHQNVSLSPGSVLILPFWVCLLFFFSHTLSHVHYLSCPTSSLIITF